MYSFLKKNIKSIFPKQFLVKNELFFRYFFGIFYLGSSKKCVVCSKHLRSFVSLKNDDLMCPFCGSLSRTRRLWSLVDQQNNLQGNILHFSPSRSLYRTIKKLNGIRYFSSDFEDEFLADYQFDITNIDQPNAIFDVIICFHVLEHILDDNKAISELHRVLKPKGTVYIQTPFKEGDIYEDNSITTSDGRLAHFGQEDHVRIYSVNGLKKRLKDGGFHVQVNTFEISNEDAFYGLKSPESILVATKPTE